MSKLDDVKRILNDPKNYNKKPELFRHDETWTAEHVNSLNIDSVAKQICTLFEQPIDRKDFLKLPMEERRRILREQARELWVNLNIWRDEHASNL